jgi:hypothetical protein
MRMQEAYRLLRVKDGQPYTLFHGFHGSRRLEQDKLLRAVERDVWNPGKKSRGTPPFTSGWHVIFDRGECQDYLERFTDKEDIRIAKVWVACTRPKPRATSNVHLARYMTIKSLDWTIDRHFTQPPSLG